jgi:hypothetical protein
MKYRHELNLKKKRLWEGIEITPDLKAVIVGIFLGDAHIHKRTKPVAPHIQYGHAADQKDLIKLVHTLLGSLTCNRNITITKPHSGSNNDVYYRFKSINHPFFDTLRIKYYVDNFYPDGSALKRFDMELLNCMDDKSLALWYMDDGSFSDHDNRCKVAFHTDGFHIDDVKLLINIMREKWGLESFIVSVNPKLVTGHTLILQPSSVEKFEKLILPYMIKCMRYKYPNQYTPPPWADNADYESGWDKLVNKAVSLPASRILPISNPISITSTIKTESGNIEYTISNASRLEVADFLEEHHYLGRPPHHSKYYVKLLIGNQMVGAAAFASLRIEAVSAKLFNIKVDFRDGLEVSRFACLDSCPRNTESFFLSECINIIKKINSKIKFLITNALL